MEVGLDFECRGVRRMSDLMIPAGSSSVEGRVDVEKKKGTALERTALGGLPGRRESRGIARLFLFRQRRSEEAGTA
jgi:hypothetical protein